MESLSANKELSCNRVNIYRICYLEGGTHGNTGELRRSSKRALTIVAG
jgi:hypothetical protein